MQRKGERQNPPPRVTPEELKHGVPIFLDQLITTLKLEESQTPPKAKAVSGPGGGPSIHSEIGISASRHGRDLSHHGFTIEQVVHEFGDLCQSITELAFEVDAPIKVDEFRTLNRCLDNGIADAVTSFTHQRTILSEDRESQALNQRLGFMAHELRNHISTAMLALSVIRTGKLGFGGATGAVLDRSLLSLNRVIDRSLAEVRLTAGMPGRNQRLSLADFISDVKISASLEAESKGCQFAVATVDGTLAVDVDRDLLFAAVGNLLQNAFKFTQPGTLVSLVAYAEGDRVRIDVQDHCGGLPPGSKDDLFVPFKQQSSDRSGVGLGLSICRRSVEANHGVLSVFDKPGIGCVFSIDLPRYAAL